MLCPKTLAELDAGDDTSALVSAIQSAPADDVAALLREIVSVTRVQALASAVQMVYSSPSHRDALNGCLWLSGCAEKGLRDIRGSVGS